MAQKYCEMGKHRDARFILSKSNPHAKFLSSHPTHGLIKIISNDEPVSLISGHLNPKIPTVIDSKGRIVTLVHRYLSSLQKKVGVSVSSGTVDQYGGTLSYLCRWIEQSQPYPNLTVDEVLEILDRQDVLSWISAMKKQGIESHKTLHTREACLKEFLNWLSTIEGGNRRDPKNSPWGREGSLGYVTASPSRASPKFITTEMVIKILNGLHSECERCMFHAQYDMGLRISELIQLKNKDIPRAELYDTSMEFIPLTISGVKGRGGQKKPRITLISRAVLNRIKRYHNTLDYTLASDWGTSDPNKPAFLTVHQRTWQNRNASKQFKDAVKRSGVPQEFKTHWMRHGTAFSVLRSDAGKTIEDRFLILQSILGHADLGTTEIYTQISPAILHNLTKEGEKINRLHEAEFIRSATYLPPLMHKERRGHS